MLSTFTTYQLYTRDQSRVLDRIAAEPVNQRLADYYRKTIGDVTSVKEFMDDYKLYSYAMTAYGLEDQIDSRALIRKVLESDLADEKSFANQLSDERFGLEESTEGNRRRRFLVAAVDRRRHGRVDLSRLGVLC